MSKIKKNGTGSFSQVAHSGNQLSMNLSFAAAQVYEKIPMIIPQYIKSRRGAGWIVPFLSLEKIDFQSPAFGIFSFLCFSFFGSTSRRSIPN